MHSTTAELLILNAWVKRHTTTPVAKQKKFNATAALRDMIDDIGVIVDNVGIVFESKDLPPLLGESRTTTVLSRITHQGELERIGIGRYRKIGWIK